MSTIQVFGLIALALLVISLIFLVPLFLSTLVCVKWREVAERDYEHLKLFPIENDRLLILRNVGDEATAALATARFVGWTASMVYEALFNVLTPLALLKANADVSRFGPIVELAWLAIELVAYLILFILSLIGCLPVLFVMGLTTIGGIGYGRTSMFLETSAESTPSGSHKVYLYETDVDGSSLVHSESYRHSPAIEQAAHWIAGLSVPRA